MHRTKKMMVQMKGKSAQQLNNRRRPANRTASLEKNLGTTYIKIHRGYLHTDCVDTAKATFQQLVRARGDKKNPWLQLQRDG
jgi:primosomal protein N''